MEPLKVFLENSLHINESILDDTDALIAGFDLDAVINLLDFQRGTLRLPSHNESKIADLCGGPVTNKNSIKALVRKQAALLVYYRSPSSYHITFTLPASPGLQFIDKSVNDWEMFGPVSWEDFIAFKGYGNSRQLSAYALPTEALKARVRKKIDFWNA